MIDILYEEQIILKLRVRSLDRVFELKERVGAKTELDPQTIGLEYNGKELHDTLKLDHCGINENGLSLTLTIIEPNPNTVTMEQIPWHAPCANLGGLPNISKDQYTLNALNGNASIVACQSASSYVSDQDSTEPNFIDSRTHGSTLYEDTFRPQSNNFVKMQR